MKAILQIIGPKGSGKTTLTGIMLSELASHRHETVSILVLDASPDMQLTQQLNLGPPKRTLYDLLHKFNEKPSLQNEAIDWGMNDLSVAVGEEIELITVGPLPRQFPVGFEKMLAYGLNRLTEVYDFVVIDGEHPYFSQYLQGDSMKTLIVITPEHWEPGLLNQENEKYRTPTVIINRCNEKALSSHLVGDIGDALDNALEAGRIRLIGKLPIYASETVLQRDLPTIFHNCLLRLDLPFIASSSR